MKHQGYLNRALTARDPRYARVMGVLGYDTSALSTEAGDAGGEEPDAELKAARDDYQEKVGKKPFHGWSAAELREKIAAHGRG